MTSPRTIVEGPQEQGINESILWTLDISPWGVNTPTNISVTVTRKSDDTDVTAGTTTGSPSAPTTTTIQTPAIHSLVAGEDYRVVIKFDAGGNTLEAYMILKGTA